MKRILAGLLLAGGLLAMPAAPEAIEFKVKGQWWIGFEAGDMNLIHKVRDGATGKQRINTEDKFNAVQRARLWLDAVASENLSGTVWFQFGNQNWGLARQGGALGADGTNVVRVRSVFIDWKVPDTRLQIRMGLQPILMPSKAGGTVILDSRAAGIVASYQFNENVSLTGLWFRPSNDNYAGNAQGRQAGYLDNMDVGGLILPLTFDGYEITPWALIGAKGKNTFKDGNNWNDGDPIFSLQPYYGTPYNEYPVGGTGKAYGTVFWAGLPIGITAFDPWNIEFDFNYGFVEEMGRYTAYKGVDANARRASTQRAGWIAKALVEYKMDWGVPGIFGWYGSGDDGNVKNGSERMPSMVPYGNFTSFYADGNLGWVFQDFTDTYAGTWGVGAQLRDLTFIEDLTHTFRVAWWGGTNSPSMVKYMDAAYAWSYGTFCYDGPYLTTKDGMLEFNLVNSYQMYENFEVNLEAGYIANFIDNSTWNKAGKRDTSFEKQDAWKVQLSFLYNF